MTLSDEILKLQTNLADSYTACNGKGATMPANQNFDNLPDCIDSIQASTPAVITSLTVTPSITQQVIAAPSGTDGYSPITVDAVTASIDSNIVAGNIKDGVSILGVTGTYTGGGSFTGIPREVNSSGVYAFPVNNFTFSLPSNATDVGSYALNTSFYGCTSLTSVNLSNLTTVSGMQALYTTFRNCTNLTSVNLSNLTTISGGQSLYNAFSGCTSLTSADLPNLTTISGNYCLYQAFYLCNNLTSVNLSNLTTVSGSNGLDSTFQSCTNLTSVNLSNLTTISGNNGFGGTFRSCTSLASVDLPNLTTVSGNNGLTQAFRSCTSLRSLSFNSLNSASFGSYTTQFNNMLQGVSGCTVHFPSNLQSVIGSWTSVTSGFGGTNTTVLFDLPATT